jgi:predicted alpha/beta hydrolase family esterase
MRLLETHHIYGAILVAAAHTDLGDEGERASGFFDEEWRWQDMPKHAQFIHQFHSRDDPLIPVEEARFVAHRLKGDNFIYEELEGYSHFFAPFQALLDALDKYSADADAN